MATNILYVKSFTGNYAFLSNFYHDEFELEGIRYITVEHAFQAMKSLDKDERRRIAKCLTPGDAKRLGRTVDLRPFWNQYHRYEVMEAAIAKKFRRYGSLAPKLLETGNILLVEGNKHHDNTWGDCSCDSRPECETTGHNMLGWMLMRRRAYLKERMG